MIARVAVIALLLVTIVTPMAQAAPQSAEPTNYCTSITVTRPWLPSDPWVITVTAGSGSYWRVREYASGAVVIPAVYDPTIPVTLAGVLVEGTEYQVQAAHNAGGPWSTSGCRFTAPPPLGVGVLSFDHSCTADGVLLTWDTATELDITSFRVDRDNAPLVTVPAQGPGSPLGYHYEYLDAGQTSHVYDLWDFDLSGQQHGPMTTIANCGPTAVRISEFRATALGPRPPLLPSRPGPATRAGMQARCSTTISPSAWPSRCPAWWR